MTRRDEERIRDILEACNKLAEIMDVGRIEYDTSWFVRDAAYYNLMVIGEAINSLSDEFVAQNPRLPVRQAKSLRNKLTHEYFAADSGIVWDTITTHVPALGAALRRASSATQSSQRPMKIDPVVQQLSSSSGGAACGAKTKTGARCGHPAPEVGGKCAAGHLRRK